MAEMLKRSSDDTPEDLEAGRRPGWEGLRVWWLIDGASAGSERLVVNTTTFPPAKWHELHRHPNAEEALYIVSGAGLHLSEGEPVRQRAGEVVYIPRGEWHGFANDTEQPAVILAVFGGVASYADAGYEIHPVQPAEMPQLPS
jgi:quercetin dioxygenase-like cupin family protein